MTSNLEKVDEGNMVDPFEEMQRKLEEKWEDEEAPWIVVEHSYTDEDKPGVQFYRIRYGSETMFIGSDDSVETAGGLDNPEKEKILRQFKKYIISEEGKADLKQIEEKKKEKEK